MIGVLAVVTLGLYLAKNRACIRFEWVMCTCKLKYSCPCSAQRMPILRRPMFICGPIPILPVPPPSLLFSPYSCIPIPLFLFLYPYSYISQSSIPNQVLVFLCPPMFLFLWSYSYVLAYLSLFILCSYFCIPNPMFQFLWSYSYGSYSCIPIPVSSFLVLYS